MPYYPPSGGGGGGGGTGTEVSGESPLGSINGSNTLFIIAHVPLSNTLKVYRNGLRQKLSVDFVYSRGRIVFAEPPIFEDILQVDYRY